MSLLDRGTDIIEIYPEVESFDSLGNPRRVPAEVPCVIRTTLHPLKASEWNFLGSTEYSVRGQQVNEMLQFITRSPLPAGAWSMIVARGREWDVVGEPNRGPRTNVTRVILRARQPAEAYG